MIPLEMFWKCDTSETSGSLKAEAAANDTVSDGRPTRPVQPQPGEVDLLT